MIDHSVPCSELRVTQERVRNLEGWQTRQNGQLQDNCKNLHELNDTLNERINGLKNWIMGALLAAVLSLLSAVVNMLSLTGGR